MFLYWLLLVLVTLAAASASPSTVGWDRALGATCLNVFAWCGLSQLALWHARYRLWHTHAEGASIEAELLTHFQRIRYSWLPANYLCVAIFGWNTIIQQAPYSEASFTFRLVGWMLPSGIVVIWSWLCEARWETFVARCLEEPNPSGLLANLMRIARTQVGWLVAPLFVGMLIIDGIRMVFGPVPTWMQGFAMLLSMPLVMPWAMRYAWRTERMEDPMIDRLVAITGLRGTSVQYWKTDHRLATAVMVGFLPWFRMLVVTDLLLTQLNRAQLAMVVLHEAAHIRRRHLILRLGSAIPLWIAVGIASAWFSDSVEAQGLALLCGGAGTLLAFRSIAHWTELDADRTACRYAVEAARAGVPEMPTTLADAARQLNSALQILTGRDARAHRGTWMHPSLWKRFSNLDRLVDTSPTTV